VDSGDWMWLVRGAGVAFPGVVTSFQIQLYILPPIVRSVVSFHPLDKYANLVDFFRQGRISETISPKMEAAIIMTCTPPPLLEALQERGTPAPSKLCLLHVSMMADTQEEYIHHMESSLWHPDFPSTPILPMEEPKDYSFSELAGLLGPAYPAGFHWKAAAYLLDNYSDSVDWDAIRASFEEHAPMGYSSTLTVCGYRRESNEGAYGPVPFPGVQVGTYGVCSNVATDMDQLVCFEDTSAAYIKPYLVKYNVLEHQLNKETFSKTFIGQAGAKLQKLRKTMDPDGIFFDPTDTPAW
jgi:FAD/FMN-containing dehydrogenase